MIVLQFCFEKSVPRVRDFPPELYLYYTHDNPTIREWFDSLPEGSPSQANLFNSSVKTLRFSCGLGLENDSDIEAPSTR